MCSQEKNLLRKRIGDLEAGLEEADLAWSDRALCRQVLSLPEWQEAETVMLFSPIRKEVRVDLLVQDARSRGKRIGLPCMQAGHRLVCREWKEEVPLKEAGMHILEPDDRAAAIAPSQIDLIVVPARCYDRLGNRLGYGAGFYDRYLRDHSARTVGMCRQVLLQEHVPADGYDVPVRIVVTEDKIYRREP